MCVCAKREICISERPHNIMTGNSHAESAIPERVVIGYFVVAGYS